MNIRKAAILAIAVVYSWIMVFIVTGLGLTLFRNPSFMGVVGFLVALGISLPVKYIYRNIDDLETSLRETFSEEKGTVLVTALLSLGSYLAFVYGSRFPFSALINLSFHASLQIFFPLRNVYSGIIGTGLSELLYSFARLYLHVLWVYLFMGIAASFVEWARDLDIYPDSDLKAGVLPFSGERNAEIEIYIVTGAHGLLKIPESFCKECHMFVRAAQEAASELDSDVDIAVRSYWTRFPRPLLKGGTHPPVMLVNGELLSQGYDVPDSVEIVEMLEKRT